MTAILSKHWKLISLCLIWFLLWCDWASWYLAPDWAHGIAFTVFAAGAGLWFWKGKARPVFERCRRATLLFVMGWQWLVFGTMNLGLHWVARFLSMTGLVAIFIGGLAWAVWFVEIQSRRYRQLSLATAGEKIWNPLNLEAWYFRQPTKKLDQSLFTFLSYSLIFLLLFLILTNLSGCREIYEMPAGGGEEKQIQVVKIQKIIEKKIVINPFSSIIFNPPPIEDVKLEFQELTKHAYEVGYGQGKGAGFSGGTNRGKVRFIRLEYQGGDWDQDFGVGSDLNMLLEYGIRTGHKVNDNTESRRIDQLKNFPKGKSPPFVYITGQKNLIVSNSDVETLREFLIEKHGMIFADNGGSSGWHGQFFAMMTKVMPTVKPVKIPLDHPIHTTPYQIPFLPYVAPHGGKDAWGWIVDGRLVAYYHPGDIGDAWADGHAGVKREIWEYCYQLGTNVIFYAHIEYNKWLDALNEAEGGKPATEN